MVTPSFPLEISVLTLLHEGGGLKSAIKISSHRLQLSKLDICVIFNKRLFYLLGVNKLAPGHI